LPPERRDDFPDMLARLRRGEHINHYETVRVRKDGRLIDMWISMSPIRDGRGRIVGAAGIGRDITERKQGEQERELLLQREKQARQATERSADRIARLQAATASLSEALTPAQVAEAIAEQTSAALGAETALIAQLSDDGQQLEIIGQVGYGAEQLRGWERFPLSTEVPLAEVVRTIEPVWSESTEERIARYPHLVKGYANTPPGFWLSVPLVAHGRAVGGISLRFPK